MKQKWMHSLTALLLAMALLLTLPVLTAQTAKAVDLSKECKLTVIAANFDKELNDAGMQVDFYKVADAVADSTYDTYSYSVADGVKLSADISNYEGLSALSNGDWQTLAQDAAKSVLLDGATVTKYEDGEHLPCGLYLIIAHGKDPAEGYVNTNDKGQIVTVINSGGYAYSILPELVSLPSTRENVTTVEGDDMTTASGEWVYDVTANLKPEQKERFGDLEIVKELTTYEDSSPVTFVFEILATMPETGETVYSDVVGLTFSKAGVRTAKIVDKIPVGANVTVTEVYNGSSYTVVGEDEKTTVIVSKDQNPARVTFENEFNKGRRKGYGIVNHFSYVEDKGWDNDNEHDSATE